MSNNYTKGMRCLYNLILFSEYIVKELYRTDEIDKQTYEFYMQSSWPLVIDNLNVFVSKKLGHHREEE